MHQITTLKAVFQKIQIKTPFWAITVVYTGDWGQVKCQRSKCHEKSKVICPRLMTALSSIETSLLNSVDYIIFETLISQFFL